MMNRINGVDIVVKEGYEIVAIIKCLGCSDVAEYDVVLNRGGAFPYVLAYNYNIEDGTWQEGKYYENGRDAMLDLSYSIY